jgi:pimeloyl-ACP methyl ester carboxylesterase
VLADIDMSWGSGADDRERWLRAFVDFWGGEGAWSSLREEARAEFRRVAWVIREGVMSLMADTTPLDAFGAFRFPVTLLTGEVSPSPAGRVIERLGGILQGAKVARLAGAGHLAPVTRPDAVNQIILDAL